MNYFSYFKCFNEVNKLNKEIKDNLNFINYEDLILDYIYEEQRFIYIGINSMRCLNLASVIFPLVENKKLISNFICNLDIHQIKSIQIKWLNLIFNYGDISNTDIPFFKERLLLYSCKCGLIEIVKYLIEISVSIDKYNSSDLLRHASANGHLEIIKCLVQNGVDIHINNDVALKWAKMNDHEEIIRYIESLN